MKPYIKVAMALMLIATQLNANAGKYIKDSLKVDGHQRIFRMYIPQNLKEDAPLLFMLHGYGSPGEINNFICETADRHGFALCVPMGLADPTGKHSWNVGYPMQDGWKVDDVKAMCKMAAYVQKKYHLSKRNTFLSGMSNGGEMCYLLAYSKQKTFKALVSIAGLTMQWIYRERTVPTPIPFLEIHGTNDTTSFWDGDLENEGGWNPYMPVPIAVNTLVARNRCEYEVKDTVVMEDRPSKRPIIRHKYLNGIEGKEVWLYEVIGGTHSWFTDDIDTGELLWEFFTKYID